MFWLSDSYCVELNRVRTRVSTVASSKIGDADRHGFQVLIILFLFSTMFSSHQSFSKEILSRSHILKVHSSVTSVEHKFDCVGF